jgi:hypothetical protein
MRIFNSPPRRIKYVFIFNLLAPPCLISYEIPQVEEPDGSSPLSGLKTLKILPFSFLRNWRGFAETSTMRREVSADLRNSTIRSSYELLNFVVRDVCKNIDDVKGGTGRPSWI